MEEAKNDEKIKRADHYHQGFAFGVIGLMFLLLTLVTSHESFSVLPVPWFLWLGSMMIGMALFVFTILLALAWLNLGIPLKYIYGTAIVIFCAFLLFYFFFLGFIGVMGSWIFSIPYSTALQNIPVGVFPLLMIATVCVGIFCATKSIAIPRPIMKITTYLILLFALVYIWGHAFRFEGYVYDEGLEVKGTTYHSIIRYGWLGDPGLVYLYQCSVGYFGCDLIYQTPDYAHYYDAETRLVYDQSMAVLRLEYQMSESTPQYDDIPPILYEHSVQ